MMKLRAGGSDEVYAKLVAIWNYKKEGVNGKVPWQVSLPKLCLPELLK